MRHRAPWEPPGPSWFVRATIAFVVGDFALAVVNIVLGNWVIAFNCFITGLYLASWPSQRRVWMKLGWLRGRVAFYDTLPEAKARGMTPAEWVVGEMERDQLLLEKGGRGG